MLRIGVTTYYEITGEKFATLIPHDYLRAVIEVEAIPIMIPVAEDPQTIDRYIELVDGILLTGGEDVDPGLYGEENTGLSHDVSCIRDRSEMYIISQALKKGMPLLGICRGLQILNIFLGGTLYQDIPSQVGTAVTHPNPMKERDEVHHPVNIKSNTLLAGVFGKERVMVNSRHHQGVKKLAAGLVVNAVADDGIIEGFEDAERNIMAVQWHPENIAGVSDGCAMLFRDLVERSATWKKAGCIQGLVPDPCF